MAFSKGSSIHLCALSSYRLPSMTNWSCFGGHTALEQMAEQTQFSLPASQAGTATKGCLHTALGKDIPVPATQSTTQPSALWPAAWVCKLLSWGPEFSRLPCESHQSHKHSRGQHDPCKGSEEALEVAEGKGWQGCFVCVRRRLGVEQTRDRPGRRNAEVGARSHSSDAAANPDACGARGHQDCVSWCPEGTGVIQKGCSILL